MKKILLKNYEEEMSILNSRITDTTYKNEIGVIRYSIKTNKDSNSFLAEIKSCLKQIDKKIIESSIFPELQEWKENLSSSFQEKFEKELTEEEAQRWLKKWNSLSIEEKIREEKNKKWSLSNWLFWFEPENRKWFWLDDTIVDSRLVEIKIAILEIPTPLDAFIYFLKIMGSDVIEEINP